MGEQDKKLQTLLGGVDVKVSAGDSEETVRVKHVTISNAVQWLACQEDELKLIGIATGKSQQWIESLSEDSIFALLDAIDEVNSDFLAQFVQRRMKRLEKVIPGFQRAALERVHSTSPNGLQG